MQQYKRTANVTLIVYTDYERLGNKLWRMIKRAGVNGHVEIYGSIESLSGAIVRKNGDAVIAVLFINNRSELMKMLQLSDRLRDLRIILVLPDRDMETVSIGHKLYPRFISYADGDLKDVGAVLYKMIGRNHKTCKKKAAAEAFLPHGGHL